MPSINIAVEGCCHGELDAIYDTINHIQTTKHTQIELLLVCGDFESIRDEDDLRSVAVPPKYRKLVCTIICADILVESSDAVYGNINVLA